MLNPLGTWTFFRRETKRFMRVYLQTVLSPIVSNLLYLAVFGVSLHRALPEVEGISYLAFLVPGLVAMGIINNSFQNPSSSIMIAKYQGIITDILTIPLKWSEILFAYLSSALLRGLIVGSVTLATMSFFVDFTYPAIGYIIVSAILLGIFFGAIGVIIGIWANEFDQFSLIQNFVLTPLLFLGGVFYPLQQLPEKFQVISQFNPIVYMIDILRYGFTGIHAFPPLYSLSIVAGMTVAAVTAAYLLLRSGWKLQT